MSDIEPLLNQRQLQKRLRLAKEKKNWTVVQMKVNLAFHLEIKVLDSGGRVERLGVWSPVWSFCDNLGHHVICWCWWWPILCFIKSKVNTAIYQEILECFVLWIVAKLYGVGDFLYQQGWAPANSAKTSTKWFADHAITVFGGITTLPDPICQEENEKDAKIEMKATIKATQASITPQQCHNLIVIIHTKWAPTQSVEYTKYTWVYFSDCGHCKSFFIYLQE